MGIFFLLKTNCIKIATILDFFSLFFPFFLFLCWVLITYILGVMNKDNTFSFCGNDSDYTVQGTMQQAVFVWFIEDKYLSSIEVLWLSGSYAHYTNHIWDLFLDHFTCCRIWVPALSCTFLLVKVWSINTLFFLLFFLIRGLKMTRIITYL